MKQIVKLNICNRSLLLLTVIVLASGIQLEATHGEGSAWVWTHICVCMTFMLMCGWHVWLHFKRSNWFTKFRRQKSQVTRILWWTAIITMLTGVAANIHWLTSSGHSPIGGVHGKFGFLMIILVVAHVVKRKRFFATKG